MNCSQIKVGNRFGRLIVLEEVEPIYGKQKTRRYLCQCDCGNTKIVRYNNLLYGGTRSCGCLVHKGLGRKYSKKLVELGIDPNTADMFYETHKNYNDDGTDQTFVRVGEFPKLQFKYYEYIPCWSTGALINLLPKTIICKDDDYDYNLFIDVISEMPYYIWCSDCYLSDFPNDFLGGDLINNLIKCIEWLKEHKYM